MTMTLPGLILLVAIAAVCGAVGKALAGGSQGGLVVSIALGFIGSLIGPVVLALIVALLRFAEQEVRKPEQS